MHYPIIGLIPFQWHKELTE